MAAHDLSTRPSRRLVVLMVCLLVSLVVTVGAAWRVEGEIARASDRLDRLRVVVGTTTDLHTETVELTATAVAFSAGGRSLDDVELARQLQQRQLAVARDDLLEIGSTRIPGLLADLDEALERLQRVVARPEVDVAAIADAGDQLAAASSRLFVEADDQLLAVEHETQVSIGTILVAGVAGIASLVVAALLALTMRLDLARNVDAARRRLDAEDARRRRAERMAIGQAEVLELIAAGRPAVEIRRAVAELMNDLTGRSWTVEGTAVAPAEPDTDAADETEVMRIAWRLVYLTDQRDRTNDALAHQANHDSLTGLVNRGQVLERIERVRRARHAAGRSGAVLFVDLDRFKQVNDSLGHDAGDELLKEVAARIEATLRGADTAGRIGGDEFAIVLDDTDETEAAEVGHRLVEIIERPLSLSAGLAEVGASIGIVLTDPDSRPEEALRHADIAMYRSKESDSSVTVFDEDLRNWYAGRNELGLALRDAIDREEIEVHLQPLVAASDSEVIGVEALARWTWNDENIPPSVFVEIAEEHGLVFALDRLVLRRACSIVAGWNRLRSRPLELAVNFSGAHVAHANVIDDVRHALAESGLEPGALTVEITEGVLLSDTGDVAERLSHLRALGIRIAVDDFGTGYSSLTYLDRLPIDILKIDRAFVNRLDEHHDDALVQAVVGLAGAMRLQTVAEGVETEEQARQLRALGCDVLQGYLFSRPLPAEEIASRWGFGAQASTTSTSA